MKKTMAAHSSTLAWKIPWTEEPGRLQSMGLQRVGHDWAISLSLFTFMYWRRKWQPTPVFLPGESQRQQSLVGSHRVRHDWATSLSLCTFMHWRRKWQPTPVFLPGESQGWGAWRAAIYGVAQSPARLNRLSSSSMPIMTCLIFDQIISFSKPRYQGKKLGTAWNIHRHITGAQ